MATPEAAPAQGANPSDNLPNNQPGPQAAQGQWNLQSLMTLVMRGIIGYWFIMTLMGNSQDGSKAPAGPKEDGSTTMTTTTTTTSSISKPSQLYPLWPYQTEMDLSIYISEEEEHKVHANSPDANLIWEFKDITMGNWSEHRVAHLDIPISPAVQNNGSLFAHIYLAKKGVPLDEKSESYKQDTIAYIKKPLIHYLQRPRIIQRKHLLSGDNKDNDEMVEEEKEERKEKSDDASQMINKEDEEETIISYWWGNLTVNVLTEAGAIPYGQLTPGLQQLFQLDPLNRTTSEGKAHMYMPLIYPNDFWRLREHMIPVNETLTSLPLRIEYYPLSMIKLQLYEQFGDSLKKQQAFYGGSSGETDEIKRMLLETNPWILAFTILVTTLHSLFDMLAFKNDIAYWKEKKDQVGVSVRSILLNVGFQAVIFLYLLDNEKSTSWMILISQGIGLVIELWKVTKALNIKFMRREGGKFAIRVERKEKKDMSETESKTAQYDAEAFRYLSWIAYPLLAGYAVYSLVYDTHKSWYSFALSTLVGYVYAFGFIAMTPQLFINYKLKSVAHMPWKTLMYKTLGTFVDDLFAFWIIKMPTLHRLACLRDDVVFFVYIYQRWIYVEDHSRANEYGQVGQDEKVNAERKDQ